ncbi:hypothetical protein RPE78_06295 [Thioclava litoralis]|uniref:ABC-2 family transporter protein n=1 Tax=Thioclava litoralis TaxID=3076557 RepID=A0ABZ1E1D6_9RHOB|nr:hypothetical protein RPE78_06295 [Thioclava sp. FTW29]
MYISILKLSLHFLANLYRNYRSILKWPAILCLIAVISETIFYLPHGSEPASLTAQYMAGFYTIVLLLLAYTHVSLALPKLALEGVVMSQPRRKDVLAQCGRVITLTLTSAAFVAVTVLLGMGTIRTPIGFPLTFCLILAVSGVIFALFIPLAGRAIGKTDHSLLAGIQIMKRTPFLMIGLALTLALANNFLAIPMSLLALLTVALPDEIALVLHILLYNLTIGCSTILFLAVTTAAYQQLCLRNRVI